MQKGRIVIATLALVVLFLGVAGCSTPPSAKSNFNLIFKYGVGARNELNTFEGTYTKDMIGDPSITVPLSLTEEELNKIYRKMVEIDFFSYPERFSVPVPPGGITGMVTPYSGYYFEVAYDSKIKQLWWDDEITNENIKADKLRKLSQLIRDIIESKDEYKQLPPAKGGYL